MVLSPRKRAPATTTSAFNQTWDDNDASFLDPNSLPLSKIPRGWDRKQEITRLGEGKEKKIWRRINLRSRAANTIEEDEEEQHDSQSRAVKKLQRMSPKAMEKTTGLNSKKRAFKATRWDRRKSVLPRKKIPRIESSLDDTEEAHEDYKQAHEEDIGSFTEVDVPSEQLSDPGESPLPEVSDRRSTFTFAMDAATFDALPDYESSDGQEETNQILDPTPTEDATLTNLFRSPAKGASNQYPGLPGKIEYPGLSHSHSDDSELKAKPGAVAEEMETQEDVTFKLVEPEVTQADRRDTQSSPKTQTLPDEILYPTLPTETPEIHRESEDAEALEHALNTDSMEEHEESSAIEEDALDLFKEGASDEEFTEASLQLNIQREYEERRREEQITPSEVKEQQVEVETDSSAEQTDSIMDADRGSVEDAVEQSEDSGTARNISCSSDVNEDEPLELPPAHQHQESAETPFDDIANGLTLSSIPTKIQSIDPTPRKLHSPPPPPRVESGPEDMTITMAIDDDTAILKDFLNRAAASKAEKAATFTHRRESLQNRRDSDVIRHALASPRKALEDKDPNSPSKYDNEVTLDLSQTLTLSMPNDALESPNPYQADVDGTADEKSLRGSRRSSRTKKSRLPAPASSAQAQTSKIAIRRADGNEVVVLKKSDAQELATVTRANTRKNKQGAFGVTVRLLKLAVDAPSLHPIDDSTKELVVGKNVRWDEQLAYYQENPETIANLLAEAESLATPDELSMCEPSTTSTAKRKTSKSSTPKIRRVRGLGTANGTPGKGLLAPASLLPEAVQEDKEAAQVPAQQLPRPKASKIKKMPVASTSIDSGLSSNLADAKLQTLEIAPVGVAATMQRKSRLAAPKKVMLPQPVSSAPGEGKENSQRHGIADATPRKGIPAPKVIVPSTAVMESGLPRRRGRKY